MSNMDIPVSVKAEENPNHAQDETIRDALDLLMNLGYEISHNGARLKRDGTHTWSWWKMQTETREVEVKA